MRTSPLGSVKVAQQGPRLRADQKHVLSPQSSSEKHRVWQKRHDAAQARGRVIKHVQLDKQHGTQSRQDGADDAKQAAAKADVQGLGSRTQQRSQTTQSHGEDASVQRTASVARTASASASAPDTASSADKYATRNEKLIADAQTKLVKGARKAIALHDLSRSLDAKEFRKRVIDVLKTEPELRTESVMERMLQMVEKFSFFQKHSKDQQWELALVATYREGSVEDVLFRQEEQPDGLFVLLSGRCGIFKTQGDMRKLVAVAGMGDSVGDIAHLDEKGRRSVSVQISSEKAEFLELSKEDLDRLAVQWRVEEEGEKTQFILTSVPVLNNVPYNILENLSPYFEKLSIAKDTVVYRQQDESSAIFFVWSGRLQIVKRIDLIKHRPGRTARPDPSGGGGGGRGAEGDQGWQFGPKKQSRSVQVAVVGPGEYFGELEVFNDLPRGSAVMATTDCTLLSLSRSSLTEAMPQSFLGALFRYSSMRVQWRNSRLMLILDNLGRLNWIPERDPRVALEPELKPLAKMRSVLLPALSHPSAEQRPWLGAHTVHAEEDAREWGLYHHGGWARMPEKGDRGREERRQPQGNAASGRRRSLVSRSSSAEDAAPHSAPGAGGTAPAGQAGGGGHGGGQSSLVQQLRQKKTELLGASYFSPAEIKLGGSFAGDG